jgi:phosphatidylinositol-3-phosphatase
MPQKNLEVTTRACRPRSSALLVVAALATGCGSSRGSARAVGEDGSGSSGDAGGPSGAGGSSSGMDSSSPGGDDAAPASSSSSGAAFLGPDSGSEGGTRAPAFDHVFVIIMENESQSAIQGNADAPYLNMLIATYAYTNMYSTSYHPSLPNYLDLTSGSTQGVICDCQPTGSVCDSTCALLTGDCGCGGISATNLGDQLDAVNVEWREYAQSMGTPCNPTLAAPYAPKHVPFLYYADVYSDSARCTQRVRDYGDFAADLAAGTYRYAFISPNLCNDMHGDPSCPSSPSEIAQGDTWLSQEVPKILATPGFAANGKDVLFIVWDEQTGSTGGSSIPMVLIVVSPLAKKGASNTPYTHESLLATIEDAFSVGRLGGAATATPITDMWK